MKRFLVILTMLAVFCGAAASQGAESGEPAPSGEVTIHATRVTIGIGYSWGEGTLNYKGKEYKFKVSGLNVVGLGMTKLNAKGAVYGLEKLNDFPGKYFGVAAGATFIKSAAGLVMKNSKGVVINLQAQQKGAELKLGNEGLSISPAWE